MAPAYVLTATVGILAMAVGEQTPVVIIAGFLPMFFAAYAYREFNKVMPDSGTSFTWTSKAFGPYVGWIGGWTAVVATIIVLSNLAGVAVQFLYQFVGSAVGSETISALWENKPINVITCLAFLAIATWVAYRGIDATEKVQIVLVSFQMIMLLVFAIMAFMKHETAGVGTDFSWAWFSPAGLDPLGLHRRPVRLDLRLLGLGHRADRQRGVQGLRPRSRSGRPALRGVDPDHLPDGHHRHADVRRAGRHRAGSAERRGLRQRVRQPRRAGPGMPLALGLYLAVLASSAASLITTFLPTTRTLLAMGAYGAMPKRFAHIHPRFKSPSTATITAGIAAAVFYTVMTILSERVLTDTILSLGIMICFYYGLVAFGCIWFFRHTLFDNAFNVIFKLLFPLLGGLGLFFVLIITLRDSASPDYGSGASVFGIGLVLVLGLGLILIGIVFMLLHAGDAAGLLPGRDPEARSGAQHEAARAPRVLRCHDGESMTAPQFGPDITFLGVRRCDLDEPETYADADVVILGAPFDGGTSYRSGTRFGPRAIRMTDYLPQDGSRPSLALRTDGLTDLNVYDAGDVEMYSGDIEVALPALEAAVQKVVRPERSRSPSAVTTRSPTPTPRAAPTCSVQGRVSMIHFDAHADTGDIEFGSLWGHGQPMRRLIESGALRGDRFLQIGLRGYWPPPETLDWMAAQNMRSYEMTEIVHRGLTECLTEAFAIATDDCEGVFLSVDIDVVRSRRRPGHRHPGTGWAVARQLLDAVRRICLELPVVGMDVVEVSPAVRPRRHHRRPGQPGRAGGAVGDRPISTASRRAQPRPPSSAARSALGDGIGQFVQPRDGDVEGEAVQRLGHRGDGAVRQLGAAPAPLSA